MLVEPRQKNPVAPYFRLPNTRLYRYIKGHSYDRYLLRLYERWQVCDHSVNHKIQQHMLLLRLLLFLRVIV
jgi:hypothetical protein